MKLYKAALAYDSRENERSSTPFFEQKGRKCYSDADALGAVGVPMLLQVSTRRFIG